MAFRPLNLGIMVLTMVLIRYAVMKPFLNLMGAQNGLEFEFQLTTLEFIGLVLSVVFIAAAGYIHNDLLDRRTDQLNQKQRASLGKQTELIYYVLSALGLCIGFAIGYAVGNIYLGIIQLVSVASLWFYNVSLKGVPLVGNIVIAFMTALVPISLGIYEVPLLNGAYMDKELYEAGFNFNVISFWTLGFGAFAFLLTLLRELVKDLEDKDGDQKAGIATLAVAGGEKVTKLVYALFTFSTLYGIFWITNNVVQDYLSTAFGIGIGLGLLLTLILLFRAKEMKDYRKISATLKLVSVIGVLYSLAVYTILNSMI